ncbi:putative leucine-rich repeat protein (LRRP) [Trypanosoma grayi]|uniref:putative leucine-rich repeat protein (LRRP) n=1 Tax=Trypanosoma grayi TaxID=71804 RepID=UPI0004F4AAD0|nr:putative leucine-rich repeat protein (LRRP) [Trypanosoma grayi]KEG12476.1 putative leucine-rich repeat protein (LRRP) [Trypanosoma grayi]
MTDEHDNAVAQPNEGTSSTVVEHLRNAIRQAMKDPETTEVVELLCDNNGWTVEDFLQTPHVFTTMELFLLSTPHLPQLRLFPYLTVVKIIHVGLTSMEPLSHLHHVEELWLNENNIRVIEGLQNMHRLQQLFLQGNLIESMDGIPHLPQLRSLWLCGNSLQHIKGLGSFPKLKSLWVASNRIATLENTFTPTMVSLEDINVANNPIYFFGQLTHLGVLRSLRSLWLGDSMYGDAPVCHLSNYTTFTLRHLPQLEQLDGVAITVEQRSLAVSVYAKKSIYYSMRGAILDRNIAALLDQLQHEAESKRNMAREALRQLDLEILELSESGHGAKPESRDATEDEKAHIFKVQRARETREVELEGIERQLLEAQQRTIFESDILHERLLLELNSCGNIRLEEGTEADSWCASAKEMLSTRFDAHLYEAVGVTGVKANRVFRIMCQGLRERFDNRMRELDIDLADTRNRRALVRLFSAVPRRPQDQRSFLHEVMMNGFTNLYPEDEGVALTNSLYYADQERLLSVGNYRDIYGFALPSESLSGQVVVWRLFLGKCVAEMGGGRNSTGNSEQPFMKRDRRRVTRQQYGEEVFSIHRASPHDSSVKVWHMFDKCLALPEYVIDFTYTTKAHLHVNPALSIYDDGAALRALLEQVLPESAHDGVNDTRTVGYPLLSFLNWLKSNTFHVFAVEETENTMRNARELHRPKYSTFHASGPLSNDVIESYARHIGCTAGDSMPHCSILHQQITSIPEVLSPKMLVSLKKLLLHNNKISCVAWKALSSAAPLLEQIDLGHNALGRVEFAGAEFPALHTLCLSFNQLHTLEDLFQLRRGAPRLNDFQMDHNPWMLDKAAEVFCFALLPQLQHLNGVAVSRRAYLTFLRKRTINFDQMALQYIISEEHKRRGECAALTGLLRSGGDDDDNNNNAHVLRARSFEQVFAELAEQTDADRALHLSAKKETLLPPLKTARAFCFRLSLMRSLEWVTWLPQLRHLSLSSHVIEDLTPLGELRHLRTLNVRDNMVTSAKPLSGLRLVSLDLSQNKLHATEGLEKLSELRFLSIGQNSIMNMSALQNCVSLEELYFPDNLVAKVRDLYPLHHLPKLVSMDAAGNPCAGRTDTEGRSEFRDYLIYNLSKLKVLNAVPISEADQQRARDVFAGRVNSELLVERAGTPGLWSNAQEVDLSQCGLREVMMLEPFTRLKVLHLHHNSLMRIDGLLPLRNLVALNLSHNRLGQCAVGNALQHLDSLRSLSLESNHITDVAALGLKLSRLKFLNLKGNEIVSIEQSLHGLTDLRELLLDNNKLRSLGPDCFSSNLQLTDISAEENYIRSTEGLQPLVWLEVLSLGSNRLSDLRLLLNDLRNASCLATATFIGNAVARKSPYRSQTIAALPALTMLDHKEVTNEDREKAELLRAAELSTPHNVVLDPSFPVEAVGGVRLGGAVSPARALSHQPPRFPVPVSQRLQLPAYKNARSASQMRENGGKTFASRVPGSQ